jgi:hypothetical protein
MAQEAGPTKAELADRIDDIEDLLEEALDPELTREELVSKVKEIQSVAQRRGRGRRDRFGERRRIGSR